MNWKVFAFLPTILIAMLSVFFVASTPALATQENPGSIHVCKIVVDQNNNIVTGSDRPGQTFAISGFTPSPETSQGAPAGVLPTSTFTTPIALDSHILAGGQGNDSQCFTYSNLALGNYYYGQESNPNSGWDSPFYSDQFTGPANTVVNLFSYDNNLFDGNQANDGSRNLDADGHIILTADRPTRILIIANRYHAVNNQPTPPANLTPTPTPSTGSGSTTSNGGGSPVTFTCNDTAPSTAPVITSVTQNGPNSVTIIWTPAGDPVSYYFINYGTQPGKYIYGNSNVGGKETTKYTINGLSGGVTYYFVVGAGNGCKPGPYSNEVSSNTAGGQVTTVPAGFTTTVLGTQTTPTPTSTNAPLQEVKGAFTVTKGISCTSCIWLPILLGEAVVLVIFFYAFRKNKKHVRKFTFGAFIGVIAYIVFLIINRHCLGGVMNFVLFSIPCFYFWAVDGVEYVVISFIFRNKVK